MPNKQSILLKSHINVIYTKIFLINMEKNFLNLFFWISFKKVKIYLNFRFAPKITILYELKNNLKIWTCFVSIMFLTICLPLGIFKQFSLVWALVIAFYRPPVGKNSVLTRSIVVCGQFLVIYDACISLSLKLYKKKACSLGCSSIII